MPLWVQYSQALATPAIALLAIVVLDLFERRMKVWKFEL